MKSGLDCGFCPRNRASMFGCFSPFALGELPVRFGLAARSAFDEPSPVVFCQPLWAAERAEPSAGQAELSAEQFAAASFVVISFLVFAVPVPHSRAQDYKLKRLVFS